MCLSVAKLLYNYDQFTSLIGRLFLRQSERIIVRSFAIEVFNTQAQYVVIDPLSYFALIAINFTLNAHDLVRTNGILPRMLTSNSSCQWLTATVKCTLSGVSLFYLGQSFSLVCGLNAWSMNERLQMKRGLHLWGYICLYAGVTLGFAQLICSTRARARRNNI